DVTGVQTCALPIFIETPDRGQVANETVYDETRQTAVTRLRRHEIAEHGGHRGRARIDDHHVAGLGDVERLVDHQVVARVQLHGARRAEDAKPLVGQVVD